MDVQAPARSIEPDAPTGATERLAGLVARARSGDRAAFDALYHATVERVFAVCLRLSGDRTRAERLTQDTFVRMWQKLSTYRGDAAFTTWLHRLTVNVVLNDQRSAGRWTARHPLLDESGGTGRASRDAPAGLRLDLEQAIASLPDGARRILVLHDIEGYRQAEIAALLGIALGTVKAQLHRARSLLRERLDR